MPDFDARDGLEMGGFIGRTRVSVVVTEEAMRIRSNGLAVLEHKLFDCLHGVEFNTKRGDRVKSSFGKSKQEAC